MPNTSLSIVALLLLFLVVPATAQVECANGNENLQIPASTPSSAFVVNDDGTVTHISTGLTWMRCRFGQTWDSMSGSCSGEVSRMTWGDALFRANGVNQGEGTLGYKDWRLPNKNEMGSILEERCYSPALNAVLFPNPDGVILYWTSSPSAAGPGSAWYIDTNDGMAMETLKSIALAVLLVRGGQ